ncbi:MAG: deoxyribose-phosphate aldolase, partial [Clostridia bacterium]
MSDNIAKYLDAAVLKPEMNRAEALAAMDTAIAYRCKTVCVRPCDIELAVARCAGTETGVSCVLAFPHGLASKRVKVFEAEDSASKGVVEIDMVANYSLIRSGLYALMTQEVREIAAVAHAHNVGLKVILETAMLTEEEIRRATVCCADAGADFVKTSTGFAGGGASEEAVRAMVEAAQGRIAVKASG